MLIRKPRKLSPLGLSAFLEAFKALCLEVRRGNADRQLRPQRQFEESGGWQSGVFNGDYGAKGITTLQRQGFQRLTASWYFAGISSKTKVRTTSAGVVAMVALGGMVSFSSFFRSSGPKSQWDGTFYTHED